MSSTQATNLPSRSAPEAGQEPLVSVVIPCLNEAANIERCVALDPLPTGQEVFITVDPKRVVLLGA